MTFEEKLNMMWSEHWIDLGDDHYLQPLYTADHLDGFLIYHKHPETEDLCSGYINVTPGAKNPDGSLRPCWTVQQEDPLTLAPSVLDVKTGDHGWIQQGRWIKA